MRRRRNAKYGLTKVHRMLHAGLLSVERYEAVRLCRDHVPACWMHRGRHATGCYGLAGIRYILNRPSAKTATKHISSSYVARPIQNRAGSLDRYVIPPLDVM